MRTRSVFAALIASGTALMVGQANAVPITIVNSSFENMQVSSSDTTPINIGDGTVTDGFQPVNYYNGATQSAWVPGWNSPGYVVFGFNAGLYDPTASDFNALFPVGENVAYTNNRIIGQTLTDTLLANTQYTLTVLVGRRKTANYAGYTVSLLAGANVIGSDTAGATLALGDHLTSTVSVNSNLVNPLFLGQALRIELYGPSNNVASFDDIRLDATPLPEPATLSLLGLAAGGLLTRRRRD